MTVLLMSHAELSRYDMLLRLERGELRVEDAASLLRLYRHNPTCPQLANSDQAQTCWETVRNGPQPRSKMR
jgi:hypothetical protein